jgi:hypothetical protein
MEREILKVNLQISDVVFAALTAIGTFRRSALVDRNYILSRYGTLAGVTWLLHSLAQSE